jgi:TonB family protein
MMSWIGGNLTYPQSCIEQRIEGRVIVSFVVDKSGAVRDAAIVKSVAPELDEAALNVVMAMPRWIPGRKGGEAVNVKYTIPLNFKLPEDNTEE